jgi:hypothetical protein
MKKVNLAACAIAATLCTSPLALAAPTPVERPTKFKTTEQSVTSYNSNLNSNFNFVASSYDEPDGTLRGYISLSFYDGSTSRFINCGGPELAKIVSVNPTNGNTIVKATIDPASPSCYSQNWPTGPLTVNVFGAYNGGYRLSSEGSSTEYFNGVTTKATYQNATFNETFTGSIPGVTFPLTGNAVNSRNTNRQKL